MCIQCIGAFVLVLYGGVYLLGISNSQCAVNCHQLLQIGFVEGNAEHLPFPDESFDLYTIAFGLRNVTNKDVS